MPLLSQQEIRDRALTFAKDWEDEAVGRCYRPQAFKSELERLEYLFGLYRKYTEPLTLVTEKETKRARKQK